MLEQMKLESGFMEKLSIKLFLKHRILFLFHVTVKVKADEAYDGTTGSGS